jgi:lipoprotein NlpD
MSVNKYIIILLSLVLALNCAPSKNIRQRNTERSRNSSSDETFYKWSSDKQSHDYVDPGASIDETEKYSRFNKEKSYFKSGTSATGNNDSGYIPKEDNTEKIKNNYSKKQQNNTINSIKDKKITVINKSPAYSRTYKVSKGDNLTKIANKLNVSIAELARINNISKDCKVKEGMKLKVPGCINDKKADKKSDTEILIEHNNQNKPNFSWPIKKVYNTKSDGLDGVKPIGIIITGETNSTVFSAAEGVVTKVGNMRGFGNYIILKHINQYLSIYSNLKDICVNEGEQVGCGKSIGRLEGNKLHFQIDYSGKPQNPLIYLTKKT